MGLDFLSGMPQLRPLPVPYGQGPQHWLPSPGLLSQVLVSCVSRALVSKMRYLCTPFQMWALMVLLLLCRMLRLQSLTGMTGTLTPQASAAIAGQLTSASSTSAGNSAGSSKSSTATGSSTTSKTTSGISNVSGNSKNNSSSSSSSSISSSTTGAATSAHSHSLAQPVVLVAGFLAAAAYTVL